MKKTLFYLLIICCISCKHKAEEEAVAPEDVRTPVTLTSISRESLSDYVDLNATAVYLQGNVIKSSTNGYIQSVNVKLNQLVKAGALAFTLKTKESKALGNTINALDPSFKFSGAVNVYATTSGYVNQLNHKAGDYVQDGEELAAITDTKSFGFLLNLPYELRPYIINNKTVDLLLPDQTHLKGTVSSIMPVLDSASQTLAVKISVSPTNTLPQNLVAKVRIIKTQKNNVIALPKAAVLTDEAQSNFWVMKMIDSITAVKVPVTKGTETGDKVEIIKPVFSPNDQIVLTGNYGLGDTAKVKIVKGE